MDKTTALRSRLNSSFGILSLFPFVSLFISVFSLIIYFAAQLLIESFSLGEAAYLKADFYIMFILPQILLPVLTAIVACLIPLVGKFKFKDCVKSKKVPAKYFVLCLFIFLGLSTVASYASYALTYFLNLIGIPVSNINSMIPVPSSVLEALLLIFAMAVLPAICEEIIYRGFLFRGISEYGRVGAVIVSSIAFSLMHGNIQQIPFAFAIGLFLGYISLRFKSLILPIILHFINNFLACVMMIMQSYMEYELISAISVCMDIFVIAVSLLSLAIFIILSVHEKKDNELEAQVEVSDKTELIESVAEVPVKEDKAEFLYAVTHSWAFWLFTAINLFITVMNIAATAVPV